MAEDALKQPLAGAVSPAAAATRRWRRAPRLHDPARGWALFGAAAVVLLVLLPLANLAAAGGHPLHVSDYLVTLAGKIMCYAIVALAMDLIWGYAGILSLGHGLFFALGGYAMGMYLMRSIGREGVYQSDLPDFMVFLDWKAIPGTGASPTTSGTRRCSSCWCRALLALVFGYFAFRSRIKGVYFSIITQALTYAFMLLFFRNDTGFGGNNGFTDFKRILGFPITAPETRVALFAPHRGRAARCATCSGASSSTSKLGRVLTAIRDAESRVMFCGYNPLHYKLFDLDALGGALRHRRRAVRAAGRHHQSGRDVAGQLDRDRDLGRPSAAAARSSGRSSARSSSTAPRAGSRRRFPSSGCSSSACCSSWSRCSCRAASSACCSGGGDEPTGRPRANTGARSAKVPSEHGRPHHRRRRAGPRPARHAHRRRRRRHDARADPLPRRHHA